MAAITLPNYPRQLTGLKIPMVLEGTLLAFGSDGGANYSLMGLGTASNQAAPCTDVLATSAFIPPIGFIQVDSATLAVATDQVTVYGAGNIVYAVTGAAVTKGLMVMSEAATQTGRVVTVTDGNFAIGVAMVASTAEDDVIPVLVTGATCIETT
jgi:hypothetical protein